MNFESPLSEDLTLLNWRICYQWISLFNTLHSLFLSFAKHNEYFLRTIVCENRIQHVKPLHSSSSVQALPADEHHHVQHSTRDILQRGTLAMTLLTTVALHSPDESSLVWLQRVKSYVTLWGVQNSAADSVRQSVDLWAGAEPSAVYWVEARHHDWKSHPSQCMGHSLTTGHTPRDNCVLFWYPRVSNEVDRVAFTK